MIRWRRGWFPIWYAFCPTEADFRKAVIKHSCDPDAHYPETAGCCVAFEDKNGERRALVVINIDWDEDPSVGLGILVHECVHVFEWMVRVMSEKEPSEEFRAYSTQAIFCDLQADISEWLTKKKG